MAQKFKTLHKLENELTQYVLREIRFYEESKYKKPNIKKAEIVTNIYDAITKYNREDLIKEVIDIICEEGDLTKQEIVDEFNKSNEEYKYFQVLDEYGLYEHIKGFISTRFLLTDPVNSLFSWCRTKRGHIFYSELNQKVKKRLKLNTLLNDYLIKIKSTTPT